MHSLLICEFTINSAAHRSELEGAMWYVIQTMAGKEEELVLFADTYMFSKDKRDNRCFVPKAEWMKRLGGEWRVQTRPLFPGYVFVETEKPDVLFMKLKPVPKFTKLLGTGECQFVPLETEEEMFFHKILDEGNNIVRLSGIGVTPDGKITWMDGPLSYMKENILKINFHKRYAVVKMRILGVDKTAILGVRLEKDQLKKDHQEVK